MIPLEGRAVAGLDEFMLRLGHLAVICSVATESSGSAHRFERDVEIKYCEEVQVPRELCGPLANYLRLKNLCPVDGKKSSAHESEFRYPDLRVAQTSDGDETVLSRGQNVKVQRQDYFLCFPEVPSKVGAISFGGKRGSKTGLSHLLDWGGFLDLFSPTGSLTVFGQLVGKWPDLEGSAAPNPYVLGAERHIIGYLAVRDDFDVFAALVELLAECKGVIRKKDAIALYIEAVTNLSDRAEGAGHLSQGRRRDLFALWREIKPKNPNEEYVGSTAWHRVSARLENMVDLGILRKEASEQFEYKYRVTDKLIAARDSLTDAKDARAWIDDHLASILAVTAVSSEILSTERLEPYLVKLLTVLSRPMSPLPLDVMACGIVALGALDDTPVTFGAARKSLENYAVERSEVARLSTGATRSAEYISLNAAALARRGR